MNNFRILSIKNAKFSKYHFYMNTNISRDLQICISVPLSDFLATLNTTKSLAITEGNDNLLRRYLGLNFILKKESLDAGK